MIFTELGSWERAWPRLGKTEVKMDIDRDIVEKKQMGEKEEKDEEEEE